MDDSWLIVDEGSHSSISSYSDKIDSDIEAELYSLVHHQEALPSEQSSTLENEQNTFKTANETKSNLNVSHNQSDNNLINNLNVSHNQSDNNLSFNCNSSTISLTNQALDFDMSQEISQMRKRKYEDTENENIIHSQNNQSIINLSNSVVESKVPEEFNKHDYNSVSQKKFKSTNNYSESDDSVIFLELETLKNDLKTNVLNDTVAVSSDSSEDILSSPERSCNNAISCNIEAKKLFEDVWHINEDDLYRRRKFFNPMRYHVVKQCSICNKKGHSALKCPVRNVIKCFICGGNHKGSKCRNRICGRCFEIGHDLRHCMIPDEFYCTHCTMKGHLRKNCPDIWRRYHLTTKPKNIVKCQSTSLHQTLYCFNCGWPGHFGVNCKAPRNFPDASLTTWPLVVSYDDPDRLLQQRDGYISKQNSSFTMTEFLNSRKEVWKNGKLEKKKRKKNLKNMRKTIDKIENERHKDRNFPRTPKQKFENEFMSPHFTNFEDNLFSRNNNEISFEEPLPESVGLIVQNELGKKNKNMLRKMRRKRAQERRKYKEMCKYQQICAS